MFEQLHCVRKRGSIAAIHFSWGETNEEVGPTDNRGGAATCPGGKGLPKCSISMESMCPLKKRVLIEET